MIMENLKNHSLFFSILSEKGNKDAIFNLSKYVL